jgi:hypothetical protein
MTTAVLIAHIDSKEWSSGFDRQISLEFWKQYAPVLAQELTVEGWGALIMAYSAISIILPD